MSNTDVSVVNLRRDNLVLRYVTLGWR